MTRAFRTVASDLTSGLSQAGGPLHSQPEAGTAHPQDVKWQKFCDRHWGGGQLILVSTQHIYTVCLRVRRGREKTVGTVFKMTGSKPRPGP